MNPSLLESLGLAIREADGAVHAELPLASGRIINPLTRRPLERAIYAVAGDRLVPVAPSEVAGLPAIPVARVADSASLEELTSDLFEEYMIWLSRRSGELAALGLSPHVDPSTLLLSAEVSSGSLSMVIGSDKQGGFRLVTARRDHRELPVPPDQRFDIAEFRERSALEGYLAALVSDGPPQDRSPAAVPDGLIDFGEVVRRFGGAALLPPRSSLEILIELRIQGERYRFAAARLAGRTFRGLLAGSRGKLWAERFELDEFPGIRALVAQVLNIPASSVELLGRPGSNPEDPA